jgi:hypothetical protein
VSRRRSPNRARFHWRPWVSIPLIHGWLRENFSKSGPSTTFGPTMAHRTVGRDYVTDTYDLLWFLPWRLRELGRFQRRRARHGGEPRHHRHGCLLLVALAGGAGLSRTPLWPLGFGLLTLTVAGILLSAGRREA